LSLAEILKRVSRGPAPALSPLRDELEFVEAYVQFQRIRYPDISLTIDFEDSAKRFVAPDFILQPLVENAFKHGMASDGTLSIRLEGRHREDGRVAITLINSVGGRDMTGSPEGIGLNLTRSRLQLSFGEDFEFTSEQHNGQYCVTIDIPGILKS
jgi:LytS/YehU family sensor histidine kinase